MVGAATRIVLGALVLVTISAMPVLAKDCPAGQVLVPKQGGVACQAMPQCPPGTSMGMGAAGFECVAPARQVAVKKNLYAFFGLRTAGVMDGICMAWIPANSPYAAKVTDEFLDPANHADSHSWVAAVSYEIDDAATHLTLSYIRHWQRDASGKTAVSDATPLTLDVPIYDKPQPSWPCSKRQWTVLLEIPQPRRPTSAWPAGSGSRPPLCLPGQANIGSLSTGACRLN
jgi:hypothetical protein